ncbi:hypothetical protein NQ176_g2571 [Zarea fungicola]|uniref:Uncharacterized protein n=1 Tax=Zarea fungicola TaxID=93591 RepID=A0ACC1NMR3_9HYPO|nr:hypothetical protein NQ176_g2571 [Lecanicillium fungicola]
MMNAADVVLDEISVIDGELINTELTSSVFPSSLDCSGSISNLLPSMGIFSPQDLRVPESVVYASSSASPKNLTPEITCNESPTLFGNDGHSNHESSDIDAVRDNLHTLFSRDSNDPVAAKPERFHKLGSNADSVMKSYKHNTRQASRLQVCGCHHASVASVNGSKCYKPLLLTAREEGNQLAAAKRVRNTIAARRSRERKAQRLDELQKTITKLEAERDDWKRAALSRFVAR